MRRLTKGQDDRPVWSPDGATIAFERQLGGKALYDVFLVAADRSRTVDLTHEPESEEQPVFSPDGRWLAVSKSLTGPGASLELIRTDGSQRLRIALRAYDYAWAPDSAALAAVGGPGAYADLYLLRLDGSLTRLTRTTAGEWKPTWAPDGALVVASGKAGQPLLLRFTEAGAPEPWQAEIHPYGDYRWSPDGRSIAFTRVFDEGLQPLPVELVVAPAGPGAERVVWRGRNDRVLPHPSWSPDGRLLVLQRCCTDIVVVPVAGGPAHVLTPFDDLDGFPRFSPDGQLIAYVTTRPDPDPGPSASP